MKKRFKWSVIIAFLLLMLIFIITGCSDNEEGTSVDVESDFLADFEGWWYRPVDYVSEGISMVDIFKIDVKTGRWTVYNNYGIASESFTCYADEDNLTLEMDAFGDVTFVYNGEELLNEDGGVEFVRGKPLDAFDGTSFQGKWYKNGDINSDYYLLDGSTYKKFSIYSQDEPEETGMWIINDVTINLDDGNSIIEPQLAFETPDDVFGGGDYTLAQDNNVLFDDFDNEFYVKESMIGTSDGDNAIVKFNLICHDWKGAEFGDPFLSFSYYGLFGITIFNNEGKGEYKTVGTWYIDEKMITLEFNDNTIEIVPYEEESMTVEYYEMIFQKESW